MEGIDLSISRREACAFGGANILPCGVAYLYICIYLYIHKYHGRYTTMWMRLHLELHMLVDDIFTRDRLAFHIMAYDCCVLLFNNRHFGNMVLY